MTSKVQKNLETILQVLDEYKRLTTEELDDAIKFCWPLDLEIIKGEVQSKLREITKAIEIVKEWQVN